MESSILNASAFVSPQKSGSALKSSQTFGREGSLNNAQTLPSSRWMHLTPAGFPSGMPGIWDDIDITMQHAPHPGLQFMDANLVIHPVF